MLRNLITSLLLVGLFSTVADADTLSISFRAQAEIDGTEVSLGSVAEIEAAPADRTYLAGLTVARAPEPGQAANVPVKDLWAQLLKFEPRLAQVRPTGATAVEIRRTGVTVGPDRIRALLESYIAKHRDSLPEARIALVDYQAPRPFVLPVGPLETEIYPADPDLLHNRSFSIIFRVNGRVLRNLSVRAGLSAIGPVVAANADLPRGTIITPDDLQLVERELGDLRSPFFHPDELVGRVVTRNLRRGDVLGDNMVEIPPAVKRGDVVSISIQRGPLALTALGVARRDGKPGESIPVRNNDSQRDVLCRVLGPGNVRVEF